MSVERTHPHIQSAYGGDGWHPRARALREELGDLWAACGIAGEWSRLRAVLLHRPGAELAASGDWEAVNMLAPLDITRAQAQHDAMAQEYRDAGVAVCYAAPAEPPRPNQMFMADLFFMTPEGAILARPASQARAGEERVAARRLADLGVPIVRSVGGRGTFEGADAIWLDPQTVILGRGLRTNDIGAAQVAAVLRDMGVTTIQVDLPFGSMHLMGMLRIVDRDLAIGWPGRLAHRAVDALRERGYQIAWLTDERESRRGFALNFVTLGPREILMAAGNRAALERLLEPYPDMLTVDEVAAVLRVHPRSVQRWARAGRFASVRAGRIYRFPRASVLHWMLESSSWAHNAPDDGLGKNESDSRYEL